MHDKASGIVAAAGSPGRIRAGIARLWRALLVGSLAGAGLGIPLGSPAAWLPDGNPVCTSPGAQYASRSAPDGWGGTFVVWFDARPGGHGIYAQRVTSSGTPANGWPANGKIVSISGTGVTDPTLVEDGSGGAYVAWAEIANPAVSTDRFIRVQRIDPAGNPAPGWFAVGVPIPSAGGMNRYPEILRSGNDALVVWRWNSAGELVTNHWGVRAQRVNANATFGWSPPQGIVLSDRPASLDLDAHAFTDGVGGAYFSWSIVDPVSDRDVVLQHVNATGGILWPPDGLLVCNQSGMQLRLQVLPDGAGGCLAVWQDHRDGLYQPELYSLRLDAAGNPPMGWPPCGAYLTTGLETQRYDPHVVPDGGGWGILVYQRLSGGVFAQRIDIHGQPFWSTPSTLVPPPTTVANLFGVPDGFGGALVSWQKLIGPADFDLYAGAVTVTGKVPFPLGGVILADADSGQVAESMSGVLPDQAMVTFSDFRNPAAEPDIYVQRFLGSSNLIVWPLPEGWYGNPIPRNAPDAIAGDVFPTSTLNGNDPSTWVSWTFEQAGPYPMPPWNAKLVLDGEDCLGEVTAEDGNEPAVYAPINQGPFAVRGGRHTLAAIADPEGQVPESDESDNLSGGQWVFAPLVTQRAEPLSRATPPSPVVPPSPIQPNADGFAFSRHPSYAWVVALAPRNSGDDDDLRLYDDYAGSESGFSNLRGASLYGDNATDFVVGHYAGTPTTVFPAAVRYSVAGGGEDYGIDQTDAQGRNAVETGSFPGQLLANDRLADVYEAYLTRGTTYSFVLAKTGGTSGLSFELFPGSAGGIHARGTGTPPNPIDPANDVLVYTATETGWHPIAVYREFGVPAVQSGSSAISYNFQWQPGTVGVEDAGGLPLRLAFAGAESNPSRSGTVFRFELPRAGAARLDLFDLSGRAVRTVVEAALEPGVHRRRWDGTDGAGVPVAAGVYFARLVYEGKTLTRRVAVLP